MSARNTPNRFGAVTKAFHWINLVMMLGMLTVGFIMVGLPNTPDKLRLIGLHKATGITILMLAALWMSWRAINIKPVYPKTMARLQRIAADANKCVLITLLFAMPLSGWVMSSAAGYPVSYFGLFTLPNLTEPDKDLRYYMVELHGLFAYLLIAGVSMHGLAALLHHFYYKDNVLRRMLPFTRENADASQSD